MAARLEQLGSGRSEKPSKSLNEAFPKPDQEAKESISHVEGVLDRLSLLEDEASESKPSKTREVSPKLSPEAREMEEKWQQVAGSRPSAQPFKTHEFVTDLLATLGSALPEEVRTFAKRVNEVMQSNDPRDRESDPEVASVIEKMEYTQAELEALKADIMTYAQNPAALVPDMARVYGDEVLSRMAKGRTLEEAFNDVKGQVVADVFIEGVMQA